jgi:hypothetical protein
MLSEVLGDRAGGGGGSHSIMCVIGPVRECCMANGWLRWWARISITWEAEGIDVRIGRARQHGCRAATA